MYCVYFLITAALCARRSEDIRVCGSCMKHADTASVCHEEVYTLSQTPKHKTPAKANTAFKTIYCNTDNHWVTQRYWFVWLQDTTVYTHTYRAQCRWEVTQFWMYRWCVLRNKIPEVHYRHLLPGCAETLYLSVRAHGISWDTPCSASLGLRAKGYYQCCEVHCNIIKTFNM